MSESINGRYLLQEKIGEGGMGVVFNAIDRLSGKSVALKRVWLGDENNLQDKDTVSIDKTNEDHRLVLAREFQILAGLRHPNIISVLDYGFDEDKQPFYTMTHLAGSKTILKAGESLDLDGKIDLIEQLLQGLAYLHRHGILHRDIKPENVLVADGIVRLLDFGLSHRADDQVTAGGSPQYIAPEVLDLQEITRSADLYAVGVLLYQFLVGRHPFGEMDIYFFQRLLTSEPDWDELDPAWHPLLESLLVKSPTDRPQSATQVLQQIRKLMDRPISKETAEIRESYLQAATFVGRESEITRLHEALQAGLDGKGSVWLIGGESGVGKSRLLDEVKTIAMVSGWQVLRGQAAETGGLPYQLWRDIVPSLILNGTLSEIELSILKEITPHIDQLLEREIPTLSASGDNNDQERLALTLVNAIRQQSQPTLLLLEDIHWARESLAPIKQVLHIMSQLPQVLLVATYRSDEAPTLPIQLPNAQSILLERLTQSEIAELSQAMIGERVNDSEIVSLLTQETEGNTFFIIEVMRALAEEAGQIDDISQMALPTGVLTRGMENLLQRRIKRLLPEDQTLLELAAVAGRQLDLPLLTQLAPRDETHAWLRRGLYVAVLSVRGNQWSFSHDKLRETILNGLDAERRKAIHRQIGEAIESLYPGDQRYNQILLEHWHEAGDIEKELTYLSPVARYLIHAVADLNQAEALLKRGMSMLSTDDPRRVELLNWLVLAYIEHFDETHFKLALGIAREAQALAEKLNDQNGLATSLYHLGDILYELDSTSEDPPVYAQRSLAIARAMNDQEKICDTLILLGEMTFHLGNIDEAISYFKETLSIVERTKLYYTLGYTLDQLGQTYIVQGNYAEASEVFKRSYAALKAGGYEQRLGWTLLDLAIPHLLSGNYEEAQDYLSQALTVFRKYQVDNGIAYALNNLGRLATLTGDYDVAEEQLRDSIEIFEKIGLFRSIGYDLLQFGLLYALQGELEQAETYLLKSLAGFQELDDSRFVAYSNARLGIVYNYLKPDLASNKLHEALTLAQSILIEPCMLEILYGYAQLYLDLGVGSEAAKLIGLVQHHPKSNKEILLWDRILGPQLAQALSPAALQEALNAGKALDLDLVVERLLLQEPQAAAVGPLSIE